MGHFYKTSCRETRDGFCVGRVDHLVCVGYVLPPEGIAASASVPPSTVGDVQVDCHTLRRMLGQLRRVQEPE
eukprot:4105837-Amphidinium_carterae.1